MKEECNCNANDHNEHYCAYCPQQSKGHDLFCPAWHDDDRCKLYQ